jgi:rhamnose transport system permease protein
MRPAPRTNARFHEVILAVLLGCVFALAWWLDPDFVRLATQLELSTHVVELALVALPMTLIIVTGGIDLSVGSTMALSSVVMGLCFEAGLPMPVACGAAVATGALAGTINGLCIARFSIHPLIVTLATLAAYRGLAEGLSKGRAFSGFPDSFLAIGAGSWLGLPIVLWIFLAVLAMWVVVIRRTTVGLWAYATGSSETAATYSGVPVAKVRLWLYTLAGLSAGLAAILFAARLNTAKADVGSGLELDVITAVVLGGTSIFGGRGTLLGTLLGIAIIHEVHQLVSWKWDQDELVQIVKGSILVAAVLLNNVFSRRRE